MTASCSTRSHEESAVDGLLQRAAIVPMRLQGRAIALSFGLGPAGDRKIPGHLATLTRLLGESAEGGRLLAAIDALSEWDQQEEVWWALSERAARLSRVSGRKVHVYCGRVYLDAMFATEAELQRWWRQYRDTVGSAPQMNADDLFEAQYYALHRRHPQPTRYDDEIFRKIESLELPHALFHALDEEGQVIAAWEVDYRSRTVANLRRWI